MANSVLTLVDRSASCIVTHDLQNTPAMNPIECKVYNEMIDKHLWDRLKVYSDQGIKDLMFDVEVNLLQHCPFSKDKTLFLEECVNEKFKELAKSCDTQSTFGNTIPVGVNAYAYLQQKWKDEALVVLWNEGLCRQLGALVPKLATAQEMRDWLEKSASAPLLLAGITKLNLSKRKIRVIPPELALCTQLRKLILSKNLIRDVDGLKSLIQLRKLLLNDNQIKDIQCLSSLTQLRKLWLQANKIKDVQIINEFVHLQFLNLNCNEVEDIQSLSQLAQLQGVELINNRIKHIPELGLLTQLFSINLEENLIEDVRTCSLPIRLEILNLSKNQISVFPDLGTLPFLRKLFLQCTKITHIPDPDKLTQLQELDISRNELLFVFYRNSAVRLDKRGCIDLYNNFKNYKCLSSFSIFLKLLAFNIDDRERIKVAFEQLHPKDQALIVKLIELKGQDDLFGNMHSFCIAVRKAISAKFDQKLGHEKDKVFAKFYSLARENGELFHRSEADWQYDEQFRYGYVYKNILRLIDAMILSEV